MSESFVDLSYRGLPLGRRIKLTQVRPSTGYLEMPTPMPVGTEIAIATDDGIAFAATVAHIHEQVGGSDRAPGMIVKPVLAAEAATTWWTARVDLPDEAPAPPPVLRPRAKTTPPPVSHVTQPGIVLPTPLTIEEATLQTEAPAPPPPLVPSPPILPDQPKEPDVVPTMGRASTILGTGPSTVVETMIADEPPIAERAKRVDSSGLLHTLDVASLEATTNEGRTTVMPAVDQELLEQLTRDPGEVEQLTRTTGDHDVVDDGKSTTIMEAVDPAALGLEAPPMSSNLLGLETTASGNFKTISPEDPAPRDSGPIETDSGASGVKKRRKRR